MFLKLFLLFVTIPVLELYVLMKLGASFGVGTTLIVVLGTGVLGAYLAKREGYRIFFRLQQEVQAGRVPANDMIDAVLVFVSGVVLLTPGVLTDFMGIFLLVPFSRVFIRRWIIFKFRDVLNKRSDFSDDFRSSGYVERD